MSSMYGIFFFDTVGDYHPVLFINKETHMKKETNRHRLDYWAPVLPSSPPSSHVLVVIQRKNGATYYTLQILTKIDNASEHGAWHIKNITK